MKGFLLTHKPEFETPFILNKETFVSVGIQSTSTKFITNNN